MIDSWSSATSGGRGPVDADVKRLLHEHLTGLDPFLAEVARTFDHLVNPSTRHPDTVVLRIDATWFTELLEVHDVAARDRAALALAMLAMHTQAQDQRIDRDLADPSLAWATDVLSSTLLVEAIAMLCGIAGGDPLFWAQTRAAFTESARGCLAERTLGTGSDELVGERLVSVVAGRMATLRILVTALACHSRRPPTGATTTHGACRPWSFCGWRNGSEGPFTSVPRTTWPTRSTSSAVWKRWLTRSTTTCAAPPS